jgi:hypothetical protein
MAIHNEEIAHKRINSCNKIIELKILRKFYTKWNASGKMNLKKTVQGLEEKRKKEL